MLLSSTSSFIGASFLLLNIHIWGAVSGGAGQETFGPEFKISKGGM